MEHTNLFLYESEADYLAAYPDGKLDDPVPGVAYIRSEEEGKNGTVHYNNDIITYSILVHSQNKSGVTVSPDKTVQSNPVLNGNVTKVKIIADPVEGMRPRNKVEKIEISSNTEHTIIYLAQTSYTITVNHIYSGAPIADPTEIIVEGVYEEEVVPVTIEPVSVQGYSASPVTISVSGDMTYNLQYDEEPIEPIEFIDMGFGVLFANKNLGAATVYDTGDLYAWGELTPKSAYTWENYRFGNYGQTETLTKYNNTDKLVILDDEDDIAHVTFGENYSMMSRDVWVSLINNSTYEIDEDNDCAVFTSKNNGNKLIIPLNGGGQSESDFAIFFWTNQRNYDDYVYGIGIGTGCESSFGPTTGCDGAIRCLGYPVRAVYYQD